MTPASAVLLVLRPLERVEEVLLERRPLLVRKPELLGRSTVSISMPSSAPSSRTLGEARLVAPEEQMLLRRKDEHDRDEYSRPPGSEHVRGGEDEPGGLS